MIEAVSIVVDKIALSKPDTEIQAKQILKDFLAKKNFPDLDLELKDLIEISINYTQLNAVSILDEDFLNFFELDGSLKTSEKRYLNTKNEEDFKMIDEIQQDIKLTLKSKYITTVKISNGITFKYKEQSFFRWDELYISESKVFGVFKFNQFNNKFTSLQKNKFTNEFGLVFFKKKIQGTIKYENIFPIINMLLDVLKNEKGSKKME